MYRNGVEFWFMLFLDSPGQEMGLVVGIAG